MGELCLLPLLAYFPYFEKIEEVSDITLLHVCLSPPPPKYQETGSCLVYKFGADRRRNTTSSNWMRCFILWSVSY
jgi:hypothetical protein